MEFHALAEIFPLMEGDDFADLVADIRANGLNDPVTLYEGKILDGRNRWRACQKLGIEPPVKKLNGQDPVAFVMSENLHRRHLTVGQKAWAAAQVANMQRGGDRVSDQSANLRNAQTSQEEAANQFKVSRRSVQTAAFIQKEGNDAEKEEAASGQTTLGKIAAKIRKRKPENRARASEQEAKRREPAKRVRKEKLVAQTIVIAAQQLNQAAETLDAIETIPDLGERIDDVIQDLRAAYQCTGRFVRRLEATSGG